MNRWEWSPHSDLPWLWDDGYFGSPDWRRRGVSWGSSERAAHLGHHSRPVGDLRHTSHPPLELGGHWGRTGWWGPHGEWVELHNTFYRLREADHRPSSDQ